MTTVHLLETGTLTFWCVSHIVVDTVKTTVHPALCDPCNYSLPHLRPEKSENREIEIQPGFTKLGQVCHGKCMEKQISNPDLCDLKWVFDPQFGPNPKLKKNSGPISDEWTVVKDNLGFEPALSPCMHSPDTLRMHTHSSKLLHVMILHLKALFEYSGQLLSLMIRYRTGTGC